VQKRQTCLSGYTEPHLIVSEDTKGESNAKKLARFALPSCILPLYHPNTSAISARFCFLLPSHFSCEEKENIVDLQSEKVREKTRD